MHCMPCCEKCPVCEKNFEHLGAHLDRCADSMRQSMELTWVGPEKDEAVADLLGNPAKFAPMLAALLGGRSAAIAKFLEHLADGDAETLAALTAAMSDFLKPERP